MNVWTFVALLVGLVFLVAGAELLVRGASSIATRLGIAPVIIGLTVVAFGTSAPELAVSVSAGISGEGEVAFGNVAGSNIVNILLILGGSAVIGTLVVSQRIIRLDIPLLIGATLVTLVLSLDNEIGRMPVDSIYSPVLKVTYKVEATRVEQRTDFDKLVIDVETKPSILPRDAIASAGKTLVELFGLARELNVEAEGIDIGPSPVDEQLAADLALPVEDLQLTVRSYNCLKREGIHTVGELISRSEQDLLDIRNFGAKSIDEVKAKLVEMGLSLKDSAPGFDPATALAAYGDDDDDAFVEDEQY